jgi:hypothetical protein
MTDKFKLKLPYRKLIRFRHSKSVKREKFFPSAFAQQALEHQSHPHDRQGIKREKQKSGESVGKTAGVAGGILTGALRLI